MRNLVILVLLFMSMKIADAQDMHFSQIHETPLLRNPALAGIFTGDLRIQGVYRSQWNTVTDAYNTGSLSGEYKIPVGQGDDFLTIATQVLYDRSGTIALTGTHVLPAINYHKSLRNDRNLYLSAALMLGYVERRFDPSKVTTNNQFNGGIFDPGAGTGENFARNNYNYFDGSAGLTINAQIGENPDNNIYIGGAYHHFNKPKNVSFFNNNTVEMQPRWVGSLGIRVGVNDYSYLTLQGDYSWQDPYQEIIGGAVYSLKLDDTEDPKYVFHAGTYVRWSDAIIPVAKMEFKPFMIGVSYDANISPLKAASRGRGGLELTISYQTFVNRSASYTNPQSRCPKF